MTNSIHLTPREQEILNMLVTRAPSNKVIARHFNITESAVKSHVSNLLKKYNANNRSQLIVFVKVSDYAE